VTFSHRRLPSRLADQRGVSLPEVLVGIIIGALVMEGIVSIIFTTNDVQKRGDDRNMIASNLSVVGLYFDRDGAQALASAPAKSQTSSIACTTEMDLGYLEGGSSVRLRTLAQGTEGPYWFQRISGSGTRTIAKNISACTWQTVQDASGDWMIRMDLTITGPGNESASQTLRVLPRLW
jgi:prepilin-type N-terminal cleavage/methylation domain-containing protein